MKFKLKRLAIISVVIILLVGVIGSTLSNGGISTFTLNKLIGGGEVLPDAICKLKTITDLHGENGRFLRSSDGSTFFEASPKFSLVDLTSDGEIVGSFRTSVLMSCQTGTQTPGSENFRTLVVSPSILKVNVLSKDSRNHLIETFVQTKVSDKRALSNGNEFLIAKFVIPVDEIMQKLDKGTYPSLQEFRVSGTVLLFYEGFDFPNTRFEFTVPENCNNALKCPNTFIFLDVINNKVGTDEKTGPDLVNEDKEREEMEKQQQEAGKDNEPSGTNLSIPDLVTDFGNCIILGDLPCLQQQKFFIFYMLGTVFAILGVVASMGRKQEQFRVIEG